MFGRFDRIHCPRCHAFLVLTPAHRGLSRVDFLHRDAALDRTDQRAHVAAYAGVLVDLVRVHIARSRAVYVAARAADEGAVRLGKAWAALPAITAPPVLGQPGEKLRLRHSRLADRLVATVFAGDVAQPAVDALVW